MRSLNTLFEGFYLGKELVKKNSVAVTLPQTNDDVLIAENRNNNIQNQIVSSPMNYSHKKTNTSEKF